MRFAAFILLAAAAGLSQTHAPSIQQGGVVPLNSPVTTIQPGEWISIFGSGLAGETALWNGNFPASLAGTSVQINGKPAYLWFVSPGQINVQAPDDTAAGTVSVAVTTTSGTALSTVNLGRFAPSFSLLDNRHVTGLILRNDGSGAYGNGTYDVMGPTGTSLGYPTVAAKPGDEVEIFGVGFGPTLPAVPAGKVFTGVAPTANAVRLLVGGVSVTPSFSGITAAGLYQINFIVPAGVPGAGSGDVSLAASVGGVETPPGVVISLQPTAPDLQSIILSLSANSITGGGSVTGIILLPGIVPAGGALVTLTSSSPDVTVPPSVTVPAGSFDATFPVTAGSVSAGETITITAAYAGGISTATLAATPAPPSFNALTLTGTWTLPGYPRISL